MYKSDKYMSTKYSPVISSSHSSKFISKKTKSVGSWESQSLIYCCK